MSVRQVVFIAGGNATRLKSVIGDLPKCLIEIGGETLIEQNIQRFSKQGIEKFHVLLGVGADQVISKLPSIAKRLNVEVTYSVEHTPLGTGGALLNSLECLDENFLVAHGDLYVDFNTEYMKAVLLHGSIDYAQVFHASSHMDDSDLIVLDEDECISDYILKPHPKNVLARNHTNAGVYGFSKSVFMKFDWQGERLDLDRELLPFLLRAGAIAKGVQNTGFIKDVGTPERLEQIQKDLKNPFRTSQLRPALFIDRDGTLNVERGHINTPDAIEIYPDVFELIQFCNTHGIRVIVITNQPVIARGEATVETLNAIHARVDQILSERGLFIDSYVYCPHHPDKGFIGEVPELKVVCNCRKPQNGMIENALKVFPINLKMSFMLGDQPSDVHAGMNSKLSTIFLSRNHVAHLQNTKSDFVISSLQEAIVILKDHFANHGIRI
jgi:mannose-1-phosphate guanylyltransferase/phosphomannomutase